MFRVSIFIFVMFMFSSPAMSADKPTGQSCTALPSFAGLDCKDKKAVFAALNELHACMKTRFTYKEQIYSEAWPTVDIPDSGPIVGGDGEWAVGCMKFWPCKEKRLAFLESSGGEPYLVMVSGNFFVDYNFDKVYDREQLSKFRVLKISGLEKDQPWFKVD